MLDKCVRCCAYNDPGPPPVVGGTGLYNLTIHVEASYFPLNCYHYHISGMELSLPDAVLLTMKFPFVILEVPPCL